MKLQTLLIASLLFSFSINAQVLLDNWSFEGTPNDAEMPNGWHACNPGSTPDILPGPWGVVSEASEGNTYMGLITRDNGEYESIGQRLKKPLKAKSCYMFNIDLAHSKTYNSYNKPIKLKIWGGKTRCSKDQLLTESEVITHPDWKTYEFTITPNGTINYIIFEAYFGDDVAKSWKGNILIDNCTEIRLCDRA